MYGFGLVPSDITGCVGATRVEQNNPSILSEPLRMTEGFRDAEKKGNLFRTQGAPASSAHKGVAFPSVPKAWL